MTVHLFCGFDEREAVGFHVFVASVLEHSSVPVSIHALDSRGLPIGSNAFTFSRFLTPCLMGFQGHAIFADACDMLMLADLGELDALFDPAFAVQVVQHPPYHTRNPVKYLGTSMQCPNPDYRRKNWASLMLLNCAHPYWSALDLACVRAFAASHGGLSLLQFGGLGADRIGALPDCWNRLVDEGQAVEGAKLLHWTAGIPAFAHYQNAPGSDRWRAQLKTLLEVA